MANPGLSFHYFHLSTVNSKYVHFKCCPMTGFEPWISEIRSNRSANWATIQMVYYNVGKRWIKIVLGISWNFSVEDDVVRQPIYFLIRPFPASFSLFSSFQYTCYWIKIWKMSRLNLKLLWQLFGQLLEKFGYFKFQHLVTLLSSDDYHKDV